MKYLFGLILLVLLSVSLISAQKAVVNANDDIVDLFETDLIAIHISVRSDKKGCLENLMPKHFEIYAKKTLLKTENSFYEVQKKQYIVSFYQDDSIPNFDWRKVIVKVKLSAEQKKAFGKVSVEKNSGCYLN